MKNVYSLYSSVDIWCICNFSLKAGSTVNMTSMYCLLHAVGNVVRTLLTMEAEKKGIYEMI
jgi:hypothetical protein